MQNINNLVNSLQKVKVISSPFKRALKWFVISVIFMAGLVSCFKLCSPDTHNVYPAIFYLENLLLLKIAFASVLAAFLYSSPDERYQKFAKILSVFSVVAWVCLFAYCIVHCLSTGHFMHMMSSSLLDFSNFVHIMLFGFLPTVWLIFMLRKAFPTHRKLVGVLSVLGSLTLAIVFTSLLEPYQAVHMLIWRYTPVLLVVIVIYLLARKIFKRP